MAIREPAAINFKQEGQTPWRKGSSTKRKSLRAAGSHASPLKLRNASRVII
jgi:hypothetical protein